MKDQTREKIEAIIKGIGSPYGEGATYQTGSLSDHLDEEDAKIMADDLEALIQQEKLKLIKDIKNQWMTDFKDSMFAGTKLVEYLDSLKEEGKDKLK